MGSDDEASLDYRELAKALQSLTPRKQAAVLQLWPWIETKLEDGLTISARTKKELRRFTRPKDPAMAEWLRSFDEDEVFYDIGANCGSLTLMAGAMHRGRIRIVAIEPSFASFESLARNLSQNDMLEFTIPLQMALLDRTGIEPMYYASKDAGTSTHAVGEPIDFQGNEFAPVEVQMMPTYRLDDLIELLDLPLPTRVKIDVDGNEPAVIEGASGALARGTVKDLAVEVVDRDQAGTTLESTRSLLAGYGYELADAFRHSHGREPTMQPGETADFLFRRRDSDPSADHGSALQPADT